jgi:hypothetical protein
MSKAAPDTKEAAPDTKEAAPTAPAVKVSKITSPLRENYKPAPQAGYFCGGE